MVVGRQEHPKSDNLFIIFSVSTQPTASVLINTLNTSSAGASLNEPPPELRQLALNRPSPPFPPSFTPAVFICMPCTGLYVVLSSLILPLRRPIRPFTTNKTLLGPPLHRDRDLFPRAPQSGGWGWSAPALNTRLSLIGHKCSVQ